MSLPKNLIFTGFLTALAFSASANAGLYGFTSANPLTAEETILNIEVAPKHIVNYRDEMRNNIIAMSQYAKSKNPDFQVLVHGGEELLNKSLWEYHLEGYNEARQKELNADDPSFLFKYKKLNTGQEPIVGPKENAYLKSIDGIVLNNHFCAPRPMNPTIPEKNIPLVSIDRCESGEAYDNAIEKAILTESLIYGFIKPQTAFKNIDKQPIINENAENIYKISQAKNISFLIDDSTYRDKQKFIDDIRNSNYDIVIIEPLFHNSVPLTAEEVDSLKFKKNGTRRLIIAKMNVSEGRRSDYFWNDKWKIGNPSWLKRPSFTDKDGIIAEYWNDSWKNINGNYFKAIADTGYDGAFLTGIENYLYFEKQTPLE